MKYRLNSKGFTLIELMITVMIMAIMAAIAFPNLSNFVANTRLTNRAGQVANLFRFAKGEAIRLGVPVVICGTQVRSDGRPSGSCNPANAASGMMAYADSNRDGAYNTADGDTMLRAVSINGNDSPQKLNVEIQTCPLTGVCGSVDALKTYVFLPNGTFGYQKTAVSSGSAATNNNAQAKFLASLTIGQNFVRVGITDKNHTRQPARYAVMSPSGSATTCKAGVNTPLDGFGAAMQKICS